MHQLEKLIAYPKDLLSVWMSTEILISQRIVLELISVSEKSILSVCYLQRGH